MTCEHVEQQLPAYVDGTLTDGQAARAELGQAIMAHLETCDSCRASAHAQSVARTVLRARAAELAHVAPPGLRTRVVANLPQDLEALGWTGQLTAFAAALMFVLVVGAVLLPVATVRSTVVLAAQLALDHLKCFTIEGDADGAPITKERAERTLKQEYDLDVTVPAPMPDQRLELMAVRRCLYGDGRAAHLMYRLSGEPVSLFVIPGVTRPADELSLFGHDQVVWTEGDRTYMLIARGGTRADLNRVASHLRTEAK
jgi:anti-sigma factor RsiW